MSRDMLVKKTLDSLTKLPERELKEVSDFAEFLIHKIEHNLMKQGIQKLAMDSESFSFLEEEEELYSKSDLKDSYK